VVASDAFISKFLDTNSASRSGTVVALFTAGAFFGAFFASFTDRIGRRGTLMLGACIYLVGGILQTAAKPLGMMYAGRFIAGIGIGVLTMVIPIYQAEISHASIRGILTSLQQTMLGIGSLAGNWIAYGCYMRWENTGDSAQWRIP
jgi:MFS family permease